MIIYLFPEKKQEKFSNKLITSSKSIDEPINDSLLPFNPYAKIQLDEYQIIEIFKYILKRTPIIPEINKFMYYTTNELKEYLYNSPEYEKLIKVQDNIVNNGIEAAVAKKNLINRIMQLYKNIYNNDVPVKMILPLRDCYIYLQLNNYLFMVMLENNNYSFFEDSVLSSYILTKKILLELFNKYFNVLELKIYAEEKISKLSAINDANNDSYIISKIEIANIIKDLIVINNDYLLIKIKSNYPNVFYEILKNTIGIQKLSTDNSDIINLKNYLSNLYNSSSSKIISNNKEKYENKNENKNENKDEIKDENKNEIKEKYQNNGGYVDDSKKDNYNDNRRVILFYYDLYKKNKDNMSVKNKDYYNDLNTAGFNKYLRTETSYYSNDIKTPNINLPFKSNYMNDLVYDEDNKSVLRLYNPIVHNKSYLLPSGYRPPICTSLGQEQLTQPVFTESKLLFQGMDINKAFSDTQVGSIMPKFIYNEFKDVKIK